MEAEVENQAMRKTQNRDQRGHFVVKVGTDTRKTLLVQMLVPGILPIQEILLLMSLKHLAYKERYNEIINSVIED